ncbi:MAG: hypothetical protein ACRENE_18000 [Polyangiaceae bacterium]
MMFAAAETVVRAVLYEGFLLYPYRASSAKNRHRWMFGTLGPRGGVDTSAMRTECLLRSGPGARVVVCVRFLQETVERRIELGELPVSSLCERAHEQLVEVGGAEGMSAGAPTARVTVGIRVCAAALGNRDDAYRLAVDIENLTTARSGDDEASSLASTHTLLGLVGDGTFCSLADPPDDLRAEALACRNVGAWPAVLSRDVVLSSPIVLPDFPVIASESAGDLFDATEIDEILTLRILTLTDAEKAEIRRQGGKGLAILQRTEALGAEDMRRLHGAVRARAAHRVCPGDRVRIVPRGRADVFDLALAGRSATVASLEEDYEGQAFVTVTIDDDPGRDLGASGQPGHRFFFRAEEVEPWS